MKMSLYSERSNMTSLPLAWPKQLLNAVRIWHAAREAMRSCASITRAAFLASAMVSLKSPSASTFTNVAAAGPALHSCVCRSSVGGGTLHGCVSRNGRTVVLLLQSN